MIFLKLCFKGCSKWICEYVTTRNYKNIFRRYFMRGFQKKTQKHKWQQAYFRVHFVLSWFWSLVWCRMLALLSWTPIPTVSINVCSPHPPPCMMLHCPFDWLGVQWERREDAWLKKCWIDFSICEAFNDVGKMDAWQVPIDEAVQDLTPLFVPRCCKKSSCHMIKYTNFP